MERRKLGALEVSAIGLGCMSMTQIYGTPDEGEAIATIPLALDHRLDPPDPSDAHPRRPHRAPTDPPPHARHSRPLPAHR